MSSVPKFKLNTGALIPAVGEDGEHLASGEYLLIGRTGLGAWSGTTKEERAVSVNWITTALKVRS